MHVNFGILKPLDQHIRNKGMRYAAYAERGSRHGGLCGRYSRQGLAIKGMAKAKPEVGKACAQAEKRAGRPELPRN